MLRAWRARGSSRGVALIEGDRPVSYEELQSAVMAITPALRSRVGQGQRLALWLPNGTEMVTLLLACLEAGVVPVPLHVGLRPRELSEVLTRLDAKGIVAHAASIDAAREALGGCLPIALPQDGGRIGPGFLDGLDARVAPSTASSLAPALILHTSGSNGTPKAVALSSANVRAIVAHRVATARIDGQSRLLVASCLTQSVGIYQTLAVLEAGGTAILHRNYEVGAMIDALARQRPTHLIMVVDAFDRLLHDPRCSAELLRGVRFACMGADRATLRVHERFRQLTGRSMHASYGLTESSWAFVNRVGSADHQLALGRPSPEVQIEVRDARGESIARGVVGELFLRSPRTMLGYWDDPEGTAEVLREGWLATGDLVRQDPDGWVWFEGRRKHLIVLPSGDCVSPVEVEDVLCSHPAVAQAVVVAVRLKDRSERPWAVVVPTDESLQMGDLRAYLAARLSASKLPQRIVLRAALPLGLSGKVHVDRLRETLEQHP